MVTNTVSSHATAHHPSQERCVVQQVGPNIKIRCVSVLGPAFRITHRTYQGWCVVQLVRCSLCYTQPVEQHTTHPKGTVLFPKQGPRQTNRCFCLWSRPWNNTLPILGRSVVPWARCSLSYTQLVEPHAADSMSNVKFFIDTICGTTHCPSMGSVLFYKRGLRYKHLLFLSCNTGVCFLMAMNMVRGILQVQKCLFTDDHCYHKKLS